MSIFGLKSARERAQENQAAQEKMIADRIAQSNANATVNASNANIPGYIPLGTLTMDPLTSIMPASNNPIIIWIKENMFLSIAGVAVLYFLLKKFKIF